MSYRKILLQAWWTVWHNKYLWFFGLFAVLLSSNSGLGAVLELSSRDSGGGFVFGFMRYYETGIFSFKAFSAMGKLIVNDPLSFVIFLTVFLLFVVLGVFLLWLSVVSQGTLVNNSAKIFSGKNHSFKQGLDTGIEKFWPVFGLNLVFKVISILIVFFVTWPLIIGITHLSSFVASFLFLVLFLLFIPLIISVSFIVKYAICYVVIKGQKIKESLRSAIDLFKKNWVASIEMGFILLSVNFLFGLAMILVFLIISIPVLFVAFAFANLNFLFMFWLTIFFALFMSFLIIIFSGAALTTFQISAWTGFFMQMIGKGMKSKFFRFLARK